ncbi:hypothetical protein A7K93_02680 [Candidatus Methylacidiphilum fumarolicum]|uniref:Uncharacterized protein n=2 Tax=Candidatus Methylacidiphilum fumarolicum TaxID=591154 RepID=I0JYP1_METFB|nr:hypothetical protein [Candidatus Methylacidiphilum fumarolicum]MBW6415086.1 hypothetical protein [Candidatus Methylacidiphilum fumarolicum]TFE69682.1 hypothetical protein A7K73_00175 [Candidatus Methylacidiphilum fumarolicum]TFE74838.1 hypothetical protein A7K93_02680 [Candidatus Methylacidiphilum fumarolicum]TFE75483.1 hypothetical protein A7K72_01470 [Candidatus Methylacidiphilum fumarolicum]TFE78008.1 hypothetical protein A7D33_00375 [Candidatus Methylacidiphilum fumarolicum]
MDNSEDIWERIRKESPFDKPDPYFLERFQARLRSEKIQNEKRRQLITYLASFCLVLVFSASLLAVGKICMQSWIRNQVFNSLEVTVESMVGDLNLLSLEKPDMMVSNTSEELWTEDIFSF